MHQACTWEAQSSACVAPRTVREAAKQAPAPCEGGWA